MDKDDRSIGQRFAQESVGIIKDGLRVNRDTKGFGNILGETFSPANIFGADSKMGKMFSSEEERNRIRSIGTQGKAEGIDPTIEQTASSSDALGKIQKDIEIIREIREEEYTDPAFRELNKEGKNSLDVSNKILAVLRNQKQAMTEVQGDKVIALLEGGAVGGGGDSSEGGSVAGGIFSGAVAGSLAAKGKGLFQAGKNKLSSFGSAIKGRVANLMPKQGFLQRAATTGGSLLRGAGGVAKGVARGVGGAGLGVGLGAVEAVSGAMGAENDLEALDISAQEAQSRKGEAIGSGAGGAGGALAGAAAGAAIGSVVPVVGTFIGGLVGGALGYFGGREAGGFLGEEIADAIPVSEEDINESNLLARDYLEAIEVKPNGYELVQKIKSEATELEATMIEATGKQPEELSENDIDAIANAALVKSIQNNEAEAIEIVGYGADGQEADRLQAEVSDNGSNGKRGMEIPDGTVSRTEYSSDNPLQMGPGDVKEYNTRLEEINNSDMKRSLKRNERRKLDMEFGAKFGGTPQQLEAREAYKQMQAEQDESNGKRGMEIPDGTVSSTVAPSAKDTLSSNGATPAMAIDDATQNAQDASTPETAPIIVQAPAPAPQPQPDVNVIVAMPKTISPDTSSGKRLVASALT